MGLVNSGGRARAGFYLRAADDAKLEVSLVASAWLRMVELMHDMQQRHLKGLEEGELPGDADLAEEAIHQVSPLARMHGIHACSGSNPIRELSMPSMSSYV